jgi:hypothetical protein
MEDREVNGVFNALFLAAGVAVLILGGMLAFSPERSASHLPTPIPQEAELEALSDTEDAPKKERPEEGEEGAEKESDSQEMNRNERARAVSQGWKR